MRALSQPKNPRVISRQPACADEHLVDAVEKTTDRSVSRQDGHAVALHDDGAELERKLVRELQLGTWGHAERRSGDSEPAELEQERSFLRTPAHETRRSAQKPSLFEADPA